MIQSRASYTIFSDCASRALVASSSSSIAGFRIIALAIAILCFCPPESCMPCSPQSVSYPSFNDLKNNRLWVQTKACWAICIICIWNRTCLRLTIWTHVHLQLLRPPQSPLTICNSFLKLFIKRNFQLNLSPFFWMGDWCGHISMHYSFWVKYFLSFTYCVSLRLGCNANTSTSILWCNCQWHNELYFAHEYYRQAYHLQFVFYEFQHYTASL